MVTGTQIEAGRQSTLVLRCYRRVAMWVLEKPAWKVLVNDQKMYILVLGNFFFEWVNILYV